jgi:serine-type D-Ala-D-Ala carboxypeptidase/endopeptidase (penicillin-binding protein 4)
MHPPSVVDPVGAAQTGRPGVARPGDEAAGAAVEDGGVGVGRWANGRLRGRGVRVGLVVVVVAGLLGTSVVALALTVPGLVPGLGRPAISAAPPPVVPRAVLGPLPATAALPSAAGLTAKLDGPAAAVPGKIGGVVLDPASGTALWQRDPGRALTPGSTGKILTAAAALLTLNPTDVMVTRVVAGPDPGTVVLIGGGDPTLTALPPGQTGVYPDPSRLTDLADQVRRAVPGPITRILVDTSLYQGPALAPGWLPSDVAAGYAAPIVSLMLDGARADPRLPDGPRVADPAMTAARALAGLLDVDPRRISAGTAAPDAAKLAAVNSAPIAELVEHALRTSDNALAEILARQVALGRKAEPSFAGASEQVLAALGQAGFDTSGAQMVDGSGLSTQDRVPPRLLGAVLAAAAAPADGPRDTEFLRPVLSGLPVAGGDGTLEDRYAPDGNASAGRGVVRAKTGTLTGVNSLAGVVTDADGRLLVFALMANGDNAAAVRPRMDAFAAALSGCGCR